MSLLFLLIAYSAVAVFFIIFNRNQAKQHAQTLIRDNVDPFMLNSKLTPQYLDSVAAGRNGAQLSSFVMSILLAALPVVSGLIAISSADDYFVLAGFALIALTPLTIIINCFWIYNKTVILAEEYVLASRTGTGMVKVERISAWIVWGGYIAFALFLTYYVGAF